MNLTNQSSFDDVARAIVLETQRRHYAPAESIACLSAGIQESGLRPGAVNPVGPWIGIYQQDGSYPGRNDPNTQITGFLDQLDKKRASPGASSDPFKNIFWLQQRPGESSADQAYANGRKAYLTEISSHVAQATDLYGRFTNGENLPDYHEYPVWSPSNSGRGGTKVDAFLLHTQEGPGDADSLAHYLANPANQVSYHYTISQASDGGVTVCDVVDTNQEAWAVLSANSRSINLCFAGSSVSWSRDQWLNQSKAIDVAAYIAVQDCKKYGIPIKVVPPPYSDRIPGISDHRYVTRILGDGTHTDVGDNFPWDVFIAAVNKYANGTPAPVPNAIEQAYKAAPWLGAKLTKEVELTTPDGRGRYAQYEHGYIYWTPTTGARPIPTNLFEAWAKLGFEKGPLGYPTRYFAVIPNTGDVQAFEGGVLYRKYGQSDGFYVHGAIGDRFAHMGFETGALGWPTSNEVKSGSGVYQDFEHGRLIWSADGVVGVPAGVNPIP